MYSALPDNWEEARPLLERILQENAGTTLRVSGTTRRRPHPPQGIGGTVGLQEVTLTWTMPSNSSDIAGWRVYKDDETKLIQSIKDPNTLTAIIKLSVTTPVGFWVSSVNAAGRESVKIQAIATPQGINLGSLSGTVNLDTQVSDGSTYGRTVQAALTSGAVDIAKSGVIGKTVEMVRNPNFESGDRDWIKQGGFTIVNDGNAYDGSFAAKYSGTTLAALRNNVIVAVQPGDTLLATCMGKRTAGTGSMAIRISWLDASQTEIADTNGTAITSTTYQTSRVIAVAPSGAFFGRVEGARVVGDASNTTAYFDQFNASLFPNSVDEVSDGITYARHLASDLTSNRIDFSKSLLNKHLDNVPDGSTYGRHLASDLTSNRIDFSKSLLNKHLGNMPDDAGTGRSASRWFYLVNGGSAAWYKLGTWVAGNQGDSLRIEYTGGVGYNTNAVQQSHATKTIRTGNDTAAPNLSGISWWESGGSAAILAVKAVATGGSTSVSNRSWDIYVQLDSFTNGHFEFVYTSNSTFTWSGASASDPGAASSTVVVGAGGRVHNAGGTGMDAVLDGSTYARHLASDLTSNRIDFSKSLLNKHLDNVPDGSTYGRPLKSSLYTGLVHPVQVSQQGVGNKVPGSQIISGSTAAGAWTLVGTISIDVPAGATTVTYTFTQAGSGSGSRAIDGIGIAIYNGGAPGTPDVSSTGASGTLVWTNPSPGTAKTGYTLGLYVSTLGGGTFANVFAVLKISYFYPYSTGVVT